MKNLIKLLPIVFILLFQSCQKNVDEDPKPQQQPNPTTDLVPQDIKWMFGGGPVKTSGNASIVNYDYVIDFGKTTRTDTNRYDYYPQYIKMIYIYDSIPGQPKVLIGSTNTFDANYPNHPCYHVPWLDVPDGYHYTSAVIEFIGTPGNPPLPSYDVYGNVVEYSYAPIVGNSYYFKYSWPTIVKPI
jgi:hypothetical protein